MYNLDKINKMIDDVNRFFSELKAFGLNENNLNNSEKFYASSMAIFGIINRAIDISEEILVKNDLPMPTEYYESFPALSRSGLLDKNIAEKLESLAKRRKMFAHFYFDVNEKEVLKLSKEIYIVKDFIEKVKKIIARGIKNGK
jgi:uncharacterized protein YutE (UPF0331/DUF86 family)